MIVPAGKLDQQIVLQSITETNVEGELVKTPVTVGTVWAHVTTEHGTEAFQAARDNARETIRAMIRYRTDVQTKWQLVWQGQTYNITAVDRSERREGNLWLTAQVVGAL